MAWYCNHYHCDDCGTDWEDEWSCCCDDECPSCGSRHWSPHKSDDLTFLLEADTRGIAIYESPISAEHGPNYTLVAIAPSKRDASTFVRCRMAAYWDAIP